MRIAIYAAALAASTLTVAQASDVSLTIPLKGKKTQVISDFKEVPTTLLLFRPLSISPQDAKLYCSTGWLGSIVQIGNVVVALDSRAIDAAKQKATIQVGETKADFVLGDSSQSPFKDNPGVIAKLVGRAEKDCFMAEEKKPDAVATQVQSKFDTQGKMERITKALSRAKKKWEKGGDSLCNNPDACMVFVKNFQILATGGVVTVMVSSQEPVEDYIDLCSVVLAGLGDINRKTAYSYVFQSFRDASMAGRAKYNAAGVEIRVKPSFDNRLECSFFQR